MIQGEERTAFSSTAPAVGTLEKVDNVEFSDRGSGDAFRLLIVEMKPWPMDSHPFRIEFDRGSAESTEQIFVDNVTSNRV